MPLNIDFQQILLHLLNFVVLFAILYFLLYKPVKSFMDKRIEYYKKLDDQAKADLARSEQIKAAYEAELAAADEAIAAKNEEARKKLDEANALRIAQAERDAEKILSDARQDAQRERTKLLNSAEREIAEMVADAAEKLVAGATTSEAYDSFLESAKENGKGNGGND